MTDQLRGPTRSFRLACAAGFWLCAAVTVVHGEELKLPGGTTRPLRFVTLNLFHGGAFSGLSGDARGLDSRLEAVVEELRRLDVDIIGVQEASTGRGRGNVAERLAAGLGLHYVYAPSNPRILGDGWVSRAIATVLPSGSESTSRPRRSSVGWTTSSWPPATPHREECSRAE